MAAGNPFLAEFLKQQLIFFGVKLSPIKLALFDRFCGDVSFDLKGSALRKFEDLFYLSEDLDLNLRVRAIMSLVEYMPKDIEREEVLLKCLSLGHSLDPLDRAYVARVLGVLIVLFHEYLTVAHCRPLLQSLLDLLLDSDAFVKHYAVLALVNLVADPKNMMLFVEAMSTRPELENFLRGLLPDPDLEVCCQIIKLIALMNAQGHELFVKMPGLLFDLIKLLDHPLLVMEAKADIFCSLLYMLPCPENQALIIKHLDTMLGNLLLLLQDPCIHFVELAISVLDQFLNHSSIQEAIAKHPLLNQLRIGLYAFMLLHPIGRDDEIYKGRGKEEIDKRVNTAFRLLSRLNVLGEVLFVSYSQHAEDGLISSGMYTGLIRGGPRGKSIPASAPDCSFWAYSRAQEYCGIYFISESTFKVDELERAAHCASAGFDGGLTPEW